MSKKDKQHQHIQQPLTPQMMNQPEKAPSTSGDPASMGSEARIQGLEKDLADKAYEAGVWEGRADELTKQLEALLVHIRPLMLDGETPEQTLERKLNHLQGDALPANGWASETARQLVEAVGPQPGLRASDVRSLLLGELLAQLLPHTGEQGQNETASDVLKRLLEQIRSLEHALDAERKGGEIMVREHRALSERMVKIQSAMVARRAPDAEAGGALATISHALAPYTSDGAAPSVKHIPNMLEVLLRQRDDLLKFFSAAPLVAVAVRDDGANGPVRERFSLLVLSWDGKAVTTTAIESVRPWGDISPYLDSTVRKHLIPAAYR